MALRTDSSFGDMDRGEFCPLSGLMEQNCICLLELRLSKKITQLIKTLKARCLCAVYGQSFLQAAASLCGVRAWWLQGSQPESPLQQEMNSSCIYINNFISIHKSQQPSLIYLKESFSVKVCAGCQRCWEKVREMIDLQGFTAVSLWKFVCCFISTPSSCTIMA